MEREGKGGGGKGLMVCYATGETGRDSVVAIQQ